MSEAARTRRTDDRVTLSVPRKLLGDLKRRYGRSIKVEDDDELVNVFETEWYRKIKAEETPARNLRAYRENRGLTQAELAERLGPTVRKQHISNMETGLKSISKAVAKRLAEVFDCPVGRFI